jgi:hypothetical protein
VTRAEFLVRYHQLDAVAVETMWRVYLPNRDSRGDLLTALDRIAEQLELDQYRAPRQAPTPPRQSPAAVPDTSPVS